MSITGSIITAAGSIGAGAAQGALSGGGGNTWANRNDEMLHKTASQWGLPTTAMGSALGGYSMITGRSPNPLDERARRQGMATGASMMQNQAKPGTAGYADAKRAAYNKEMAVQSSPRGSDVVGMMYALYMGTMMLKGNKG